MTNEDHYRKLERMYAKAFCNRYDSPEIQISKKEAIVRIPVKEDFFHTGNAVHGSVYFKALDDASFFAVNSLVKDVLVLTVGFHLHLVRPISTGYIESRGRVVFSSPRLFVAEAIAMDDRGREIARGSGNFVKGKVKLDSQVGYL